MNIEEIKMDHFENFEELIKACKMWIRDDDIDAYYRFFEFNCMKALLTAYEKEKKKNKEIEELKEESKEYQIGFAQGCYEKDLDWEEKIKAKIEELDEKIKVKKEIAKNPMDRVSGRLLTDSIVELEKTKKVLQSLLEKE